MRILHSVREMQRPENGQFTTFFILRNECVVSQNMPFCLKSRSNTKPKHPTSKKSAPQHSSVTLCRYKSTAVHNNTWASTTAPKTSLHMPRFEVTYMTASPLVSYPRAYQRICTPPWSHREPQSHVCEKPLILSILL